MKLITETHVEHIRGTISCRDHIIIQGILPPFVTQMKLDFAEKIKKTCKFLHFFLLCFT